jgi:hypothetical protein
VDRRDVWIGEMCGSAKGVREWKGDVVEGVWMGEGGSVFLSGGTPDNRGLI